MDVSGYPIRDRAVRRYSVEDIDDIDWMEREDALALFAKTPGQTLRRPSAAGYLLLDMDVPPDLQ